MGVRGWIGFVVVAAVALSTPGVLRSRFVVQQRAAFALRRARSDVANGAFDKARFELRTALRLQPGDVVARRELAEMEQRLGNAELAFLEYEALSEMHPEDPEAWVRLADLMVKSGQLEAPEEVLDASIDLNPHLAEARHLRGTIRLRLGRYYGALQDARVAVTVSPGDGDAWLLLVRATARSQGREAGRTIAQKAIDTVGKLPALVALLTALTSDATAADLGPTPAPPPRFRVDEASRANLAPSAREHWPGHLAAIRQSFDEALGRRDWLEAQRMIDSAAGAYPASAFVPFLGGMLELARENLEQAELKFAEAKAISPRLPATLAALRRLWTMKRGPLFAAQELLRLGTEDPGCSTARYLAARAFIEARDPFRAEAALRAGLKLQPDSAVPYRQVTNYYLALDRTAEALDNCRQGLERFPDDTGLQMMLAQVEVEMGHSQDAIDAYERLLAVKPALDVAQYKLGVLLADDPRGESRRRFLEVFETVRADTPSDPGLLDALGWMAYRAHDKLHARELLEAAVKGSPDEPRFHYHLAAVYADDKQLIRAREELKTALASPNAVPGRIDAVRRLRQGDASVTPKGGVGETSPSK
jgi:tetratricopeptide (TPR) repeat protein